MDTDFHPAVDDGTEYLYNQGSGYDAEGKVRHVQLDQQIEQGAVADDAEYVGNVAAFALAQLVVAPAVELSVKIDAESRKEYGEEVDNQRKNDFGHNGEHVQIAEHEQCDKGQYRKVEGGKDDGDDSRSQNNP